MEKSTNKEACFLEILDNLKNKPSTPRDQGTNFENLVKVYLQNDIQYKDRFKNIWLWGEYPNKNTSDCGIDIIAEEEDGLCAIQCKFYQKNHRIEKKDVDTFLSESSKEGYTSRIIVSTTSNWSKKAEEALRDQNPPVTRIDYHTLANSSIDWCKYLENKNITHNIIKKELRDHQKIALEKTKEYFKNENKGKLIMACGTGKTFTSLKILEETVPLGGSALVLLPSLALLSQTHKEWSEQANKKLKQFAVCSDNKIGKNEEDFSLMDLAIPATTNYKSLVKKAINTADSITVIYTTYHSIEVIKEAQEAGLPEFNLVICDEAHRTTGIDTPKSKNESSFFVKIHDENYIKAQKRLYMTATPKIYTEDSKKKADEGNVKIYSMDDKQKYGKEIYNLGFGEAVEKDLLTDYEVLVLLVDDVQVNKLLASLLDEDKKTLNTNEVVKIIGCHNGLKGEVYDIEGLTRNLNKPLKRAISFTNTIAESKAICEKFKIVIDILQKDSPENANFDCQFNHIDGTMNALQRKEKLSWLKGEDIRDYEARILSNAKCLSEGVDVPSLDTVLFLQPRKSQVDIVQAVGRVMRKAQGKDKGYVIIPIVVVPGVKPADALANNPDYQTIWNVVNALKAHDQKLEAELNLGNFDRIKIKAAAIGKSISYSQEVSSLQQGDLTDYFSPEFLKTAISISNNIKTTIVKKNSSPEYWRYWAQDIAHIAQANTERIKDLITNNSKAKKAFNKFLSSLHKNINSSISSEEAVEMLSQHIITQPVFNALFENHKFTSHNAISKEMQSVLTTLEKNMLDNTNEKLEKFYTSVQSKAKAAKNQADQQHLILSLYDNFFKTAFPKMAQRLGIVYTPVEIVDFIIHSVEHVLQTEFNSSLSNKNVNILDPFTGTGTFITRLLQSGLIKKEDLKHKYQNEIHANEIILLAYYIAAVNIEMAYHYLAKEQNQENTYTPFNKIVLTDTFNLNEKENKEEPTQQFLEIEGINLEENNELRHEQIKLPIQVIIGNPPYSSGQRSENDNNKNLKYPILDESIKNTYVKNTTEKGGNKKSLYDSYIRAFRWATNKLLSSMKTESNQKNTIQGGVIGFVTNGSFIDSNATDGLRKTLTQEFNKIYVFNLRGNQRTSGELSRKEGGKIFDSGSRATIAITILVKNPTKNPSNPHKCQLFYHDIGDYLKRVEKLNTIKTFKSIANVPWQTITPNKKHDWINQRNNFEYEESFIPLGDKKNTTNITPIFNNYSCGLASSRDSWVYNFSKQKLTENMQKTIDYYNNEVNRYQQEIANNTENHNINIDKFVNNDPTKISWSRALKKSLRQEIPLSFNQNNIITSIYRPFCKQYLYYNKDFNEEIYQLPQIFPTPKHPNIAISVPGKGNGKNFTPFITNTLPDYCVLFASQWFPLYTYKPVNKQNNLNIHANQSTTLGSNNYHSNNLTNHLTNNNTNSNATTNKPSNNQPHSVTNCSNNNTTSNNTTNIATNNINQTNCYTTLNSGNTSYKHFTNTENSTINFLENNNFNNTNSQSINNNNSNYEGYTREENINDYTLKQFQVVYNNTTITKEDIFYYIYGLLHSKDYATKYAEYLKKEIPKIPYAENFEAFTKAGRDLANLHLNYETLPESKDVVVTADFPETALIKKPTKNDLTNKYTTTTEELEEIEEQLQLLEGKITEKDIKHTKYLNTNAPLENLNNSSLLKYNNLESLLQTKAINPEFFTVNQIKYRNKDDKSIILFNGYITLKNIPLSAYKYIVNGKSAIDWIIDRYQTTVHKDTNIVNNPNTYSEDPKYVLKLLLKIIHLSIESVNIVNSLPPLVVKNIN